MSPVPGRLLLSIYLPTALLGFGQGMVVPTVPLFAERYDVAPGLAAQAVTAVQIGRLVTLLPGGRLVDHRGTRAALVLGPVLVVASAVSTALAPAFVVLLAAQFVAGVGTSLWQIGQEVEAVQLVRRDQRGRTLSVFFGVLSAAVAFGPVVGGFLADRLDVRAVFVTYAGLGLAVLAVGRAVPIRPSAALPQQARVTAARTAEPRWGMLSSGLQAIEPAYRTTFVVLLVGTFAASGRQAMTSAFLPLYVVGNLGYSSTEVGLLFGVVGMVNLLMIGPAGLVSDKLGRKAAVVPAAALAAIAFALYPLAHDLVTLALLSGLLGIASGFALGSMTTYTYDIIPTSARATLQGVRRLVGDGGAIAGPALGGAIASSAGPAAAFLAFAPVHLASAVLLAAMARESVRR